MEIEIKCNEILLNKYINDLDKFVIDFIKILDELKIKYVLVAGYIAILFGRSRGTEDVDIIIEPLEKKRFGSLFKLLDKNGFMCINTDDSIDAFEYLTSNSAIRLCKKNAYNPNMEMKFAKVNLDFEILDDNIKVKLNGDKLIISPIELQIMYKRIELKSDKDFEDALYLEEIFKEKLDYDKMKYFEGRVNDVIRQKKA